MGHAILDLLSTHNKETRTPKEVTFLESCLFITAGFFTVGALGGGAAVWAATRKLWKPYRFSLSSGAGYLFGVWMCNRSLDSCADYILSQDGSIFQKELANIIVTKYQNDPLVMRLLSKHLYLERVFDDATPNTPKLRWRYRNSSGDDVVRGHRTHDHETYGTRTDSHHKSQSKSENVTDSKRQTLGTKQFFTKPGLDIMSEVDPLDGLFSAPAEEIDHPDTPKKPPGMHHRGHRRYHRRRRVRNHDDLSNSEYAAAV